VAVVEGQRCLHRVDAFADVGVDWLARPIGRHDTTKVAEQATEAQRLPSRERTRNAGCQAPEHRRQRPTGALH
jgi:hypothetical protein